MSILNGYCTLAEYKAYQRITSTDSTDDTFIEKDIEAASRWIDQQAARRFYADSTDTDYKYDVPSGSKLYFEEDYSSISSVTNGDGTSLTVNTDFVLLPANSTPKYAVMLLNGKAWVSSATTGNTLAITVSGKQGINGSTTGTLSATAYSDLWLACLEIAKSLYSRRFGENMNTKTIVTPAGVVQIPEGVPDWAAMTIANHRRPQVF